MLYTMINYDTALLLLQKYKLSENLINHCIGVSDIAFKLANEIFKTNPNLTIKPEKVRIAWLLHDIWRAREWFHELHSQTILYEEWLDSLADIVMHGFLYEQFLIIWIHKPQYLPTTIENKIVSLSDMYYNHTNQKVSLEERLDDIIYRYADNTDFLKVVALAQPRFKNLE